MIGQSWLLLSQDTLDDTMDCPECQECEGEGVTNVEVRCPCEGCIDGEHIVETECGMEAYAPCDRCGGSGTVTVKEWPCSWCDGTGKDHTWGEWKKQMTLFGNTIEFRACEWCGEVMWRKEMDKIEEKRKELDERM